MGIFSRKPKTEALALPAVRQDGVTRADGWFSAIGGFGVVGQDKRLGTTLVPDYVSDSEAMNLWRGNDIAARIIEAIPTECFRQGFEVNLPEKDQSEAVSAKLEDLNASAMMRLVKCYERAYGGGAIYPVINDGSDSLAKPLNTARISGLSHLIVFEPRELQPTKFYSSPTDVLFREPELYRVQPLSRGGLASSTFEIHESRLITFPGIRVSTNQTTANGWGDSVLNRVTALLRDFGIAWDAVGVLLDDFSQASLKIENLADLIAQDKDEVIKARIRAVELSRSVINMVVCGAGEEYERKQTPVSGLAELLAAFATRVAAAAQMPVTKLMGQSPAGLNATGESDIRFWYDTVGGEQELGCKPQLERLVKLVLLSNDGPTNGKEPPVWSVAFNPLWQPSEQEIATTRKVVADTDVAYINAMVYSPEEVALARFGGDTYSLEMNIDFEERAKLNVAAPAPVSAEPPEPDPVAIVPPPVVDPAAPVVVPPPVEEPEELDDVTRADAQHRNPLGDFGPKRQGFPIMLPDAIREKLDAEELDTLLETRQRGNEVLTVHRHPSGHPRVSVWWQDAEGNWS